MVCDVASARCQGRDHIPLCVVCDTSNSQFLSCALSPSCASLLTTNDRLWRAEGSGGYGDLDQRPCALVVAEAAGPEEEDNTAQAVESVEEGAETALCDERTGGGSAAGRGVRQGEEADVAARVAR